MTTIQDVAKYAQVGVATVSRVLNASGYVKEETKQKVLRAIEELDYTPNEMARSLYRKKTGIVAILFPDVSHPYFSEFTNTVEMALSARGYQSMICNTRREQNNETQFLELLKQQRVDGIITGVHTLDISQYQNINRPIVALDRQLGDHIPCVAVNHEEGGRLAAEALIKAGCKNVLQVTGVAHVSTPSNIRHQVFRQVMKSHGVVCHDYISKWNAFEYEDYAEAAKEILEQMDGIDGFFATDMMTTVMIHALLAKGLRYPEDIKVVSYDGTYISRLPYPTLTTVVQPIQELARTCVDVLLDQMAGKTTERMNIRLNVTLREGDSTRPFV